MQRPVLPGEQRLLDLLHELTGRRDARKEWPGPPIFYGLVKNVTVPVPRLPVLFCTAVIAAW